MAGLPEGKKSFREAEPGSRGEGGHTRSEWVGLMGKFGELILHIDMFYLREQP